MNKLLNKVLLFICTLSCMLIVMIPKTALADQEKEVTFTISGIPQGYTDKITLNFKDSAGNLTKVELSAYTSYTTKQTIRCDSYAYLGATFSASELFKVSMENIVVGNTDGQVFTGTLVSDDEKADNRSTGAVSSSSTTNSDSKVKDKYFKGMTDAKILDWYVETLTKLYYNKEADLQAASLSEQLDYMIYSLKSFCESSLQSENMRQESFFEQRMTLVLSGHKRGTEYYDTVYKIYRYAWEQYQNGTPADFSSYNPITKQYNESVSSNETNGNTKNSSGISNGADNKDNTSKNSSLENQTQDENKESSQPLVVKLLRKSWLTLIILLIVTGFIVVIKIRNLKNREIDA